MAIVLSSVLCNSSKAMISIESTPNFGYVHYSLDESKISLQQFSNASSILGNQYTSGIPEITIKKMNWAKINWEKMKKNFDKLKEKEKEKINEENSSEQINYCLIDFKNFVKKFQNNQMFCISKKSDVSDSKTFLEEVEFKKDVCEKNIELFRESIAKNLKIIINSNINHVKSKFMKMFKEDLNSKIEGLGDAFEYLGSLYDNGKTNTNCFLHEVFRKCRENSFPPFVNMLPASFDILLVEMFMNTFENDDIVKAAKKTDFFYKLFNYYCYRKVEEIDEFCEIIDRKEIDGETDPRFNIIFPTGEEPILKELDLIIKEYNEVYDKVLQKDELLTEEMFERIDTFNFKSFMDSYNKDDALYRMIVKFHTELYWFEIRTVMKSVRDLFAKDIEELSNIPV